MLAVFVFAWLVIASVCAYDTFLTVRLFEVMGDVERNPIGVSLIHTGGVPLFVAVKMLGLVCAILFSFVVWQRVTMRRKLVFSCVFVSALHVLLLGYLQTDLVQMHLVRQQASLPEVPPTASVTLDELNRTDATWADIQTARLPVTAENDGPAL